MNTEAFLIKFRQIYANLPSASRGEIVAVIDDEPYTWNSARIEIENLTERGKKILDLLIKLKIIK